MTPPVRLTLLGTFRLDVLGHPSPLPTRKAEGLLAYLAIRRVPQRRDALARLFWGDVSTAQAKHSLRQTLTRLRRAFEPVGRPVLVTTADAVSVDPSMIELDVTAFEHFARLKQPDDWARAAALFRGDLLDSIRLREAGFDAWLAGERARLHHLAVAVRSRHLAHLFHSGQDEAAIAEAEALLLLDSTVEHVHRTLMTLHRRQGNPTMALRQYNACARILQEELGVEPDLATRQLCQEILIERARGRQLTDDDRSIASRVTLRARSAAVLVVDTTPVLRATLERMLRRAGYTVVLATHERLPQTQKAQPSYAAVIAGGHTTRAREQLLQRLARQEYRGPVFFLTNGAPAQIETAANGMRIGYLRRPIQPRALLEMLNASLSDSTAAPGS